MADDFTSYKVAVSEQSSSTKFNNFVQAAQDAVNSIDNSNISAGAAIAVSKLAAGSDTQVLTSTSGTAGWAAAPAGGSTPSGLISAYGGSSAPSGWLMCDGSAVSRSTYSGLFTAIGSTYGNGDGSTTFNVPDLRGRTAVGKGSNGSVNTLNASDGVAEGNRRPQHRHTPHTHTLTGTTGGGSSSGGGNGVGTAQFQTGTISSSDGGSGNGNDSLDAPAFLVINYIIKT